MREQILFEAEMLLVFQVWMEVFQGKRCVLLLLVGNEGMTFSLLKKLSKKIVVIVYLKTLQFWRPVCMVGRLLWKNTTDLPSRGFVDGRLLTGAETVKCSCEGFASMTSHLYLKWEKIGKHTVRT
jgi:hypothetical protein